MKSNAKEYEICKDCKHNVVMLNTIEPEPVEIIKTVGNKKEVIQSFEWVEVKLCPRCHYQRKRD